MKRFVPILCRLRDLWAEERALVATVCTLAVAMAWTISNLRPYSESPWRAQAGLLAFAFGLLGWWSAREWSRARHVWFIATFADRRTAIVARVGFAATAAVLAGLATLLGLVPGIWLAVSPGRTILWIAAASATGLVYFLLGYLAGLLLPRAGSIAVLLLWIRPFVDIPSSTVVNLLLPPFTLYAPRGLWMDFPVEPQFIRFLAIHQLFFCVCATLTACALVQRRDTPFA